MFQFLCRRDATRGRTNLRSDPFTELLHLDQKSEILVSRKARSLQIVADDEHRNLLVRRNNHRPCYARLDVRAMAAFLTSEAEACRHKQGFEGAPMLGRESWHGAKLRLSQTAPQFDPHPVWPAP